MATDDESRAQPCQLSSQAGTAGPVKAAGVEMMLKEAVGNANVRCGLQEGELGRPELRSVLESVLKGRQGLPTISHLGSASGPASGCSDSLVWRGGNVRVHACVLEVDHASKSRSALVFIWP